MHKTPLLLLLLFLIVTVLVSMQVVFKANPIDISRYFIAQIASSIGVTVGVPSNPFNTLAQQLQEKESVLIEKEKEIKQKEIALQEQTKGESAGQKRTLLYILFGGALLLSLIALNFYLDYRRRRSNEPRKYIN